MTKEDVVRDISNALWVEGIPNDKPTHKAVIEAFGAVVIDAVARGETVFLRGFGTFKPVVANAKPARNFTTSQTMLVPAHNVPKFKPAIEFKAQVKSSDHLNKQ